MAHSVRIVMTRCLKLFLVLFSFTFFQSSFAQGPIPGFTILNGGAAYNGHYYYISNAPVNGSAIAATVAGTGGYAAAIHDQAENDAIQNMVIAFNETIFGAGNGLAAGGSFIDQRNVWIGFTDAAAFSTETNFVWMNGEPICFTNWNVCEPNNFQAAIDEDFTQMLVMQDYAYALPPGSTCSQTPGSNIHPLGKWNDYFNGPNGLGSNTLRVVLEVGTPPTSCVPPSTGDQGCSLGYWKNHPGSWQVYTTGQTLEFVFDMPDALGMDNTTLMQALNFGGGPGVLGGAKNLMRQAVAALLNSAHSGVDYPLTTAQVIAQVNAALATNNRDAMLALASTLDGYNNLHGASICSDGTSRIGNPMTETAGLEKAFAVSGYPNPSRSGFSIQIDGLSTEKASVKVTDITGRLVEQRSNVSANQVLRIGDNYRAGMYYVEVTQGMSKKQLKLVKQ